MSDINHNQGALTLSQLSLTEPFCKKVFYGLTIHKSHVFTYVKAPAPPVFIETELRMGLETVLRIAVLRGAYPLVRVRSRTRPKSPSQAKPDPFKTPSRFATPTR